LTDWKYKTYCGKCHGKSTYIVANMLKTCMTCKGRGFIYKLEALRKDLKKDFHVCNNLGRSCMNQYHIHLCDVNQKIPKGCHGIILMAKRQGLITDPISFKPEWLMEKSK